MQIHKKTLFLWFDNRSNQDYNEKNISHQLSFLIIKFMALTEYIFVSIHYSFYLNNNIHT